MFTALNNLGWPAKQIFSAAAAQIVLEDQIRVIQIADDKSKLAK